ncbi:MAG: LytR/AlgR family response regulator transcription factor [Bacillus sp. (in: firmicutes)]|jgi:two-component system, LytTR family, response regulator
MRVLISEDDPASRKLLKHLILLLPNYQIVGEVENGEELIHNVMKEKPDIALVDIGLPLLDGMEAVRTCKQIHPSLQVIFVTGHDEYALEAFKVNAIDYIVKPIDRNRLYGALERAAGMAAQSQHQGQLKKDLMIKQHNQIIFVPLDEVLFIERAERKAVVHTLHKKYEINEALTNLENILDSRFVASHRSYLINLEALTRIETASQNYKAYFKDYQETAKISKNKLTELQKYKSL